MRCAAASGVSGCIDRHEQVLEIAVHHVDHQHALVAGVVEVTFPFMR
jgi:hypothetical protein